MLLQQSFRLNTLIGKFTHVKASRLFPALGVSIGLIWATCAQITFMFLQDAASHQVKSTIQSEFAMVKGTSEDFFQMGQAIEELERLEVIHCSRLVYNAGSPSTILDSRFRGGCSISRLGLSGTFINVPIVTVSGSEFLLSTFTKNPPSFFLALWLARILGWTVITLLMIAFRIRSASFERMHELSLEGANALNRLAAQLSHDIKSPLSALNLVVSLIKGIPEEHRSILKSANQRINDIANQLLLRSKANEGNLNTELQPNTAVMVTSMIDSLLSEKRMEFRHRTEIDIFADLHGGYGAFVSVQRSDISRAISNLIDNAVEAIDKRGTVEVLLSTRDAFVQIHIRDNGIGMTADQLDNFGLRGSTSKETGSGLGAHQAKEVIQTVGGKIEVTSDPGRGTEVKIELPLVPAPAWFIESIDLAKFDRVISIDDDQTIHNVWKSRIGSLNCRDENMNLMSFSQSADLAKWLLTEDKANTLFLFDYELLGQQFTGLELIEKFEIVKQSILVTSHHDDEAIRARADQLGVRIIPKSLAHLVPLHS